MTEKESRAREIMRKAFEEIKSLGIRTTMEFGCSLKTVSCPSVNDFRFYDEDEEMRREYPLFSKCEFEGSLN